MASKNDETSSVLEGGNETLQEGAELAPDWDPEAMVPARMTRAGGPLV